LNVVVDVPQAAPRPVRSGVGIDLGLKDFAALSNGEKIENPRLLGRLADKLATAQRAGKKRQATNLHARIGNARRDFHHQLSIRIVREFDYIAVGNVNAAGLAKTRLAKSVLDAGWSSFRHMLRYKAIAHGAWYEEINESFSSRVCSSCASETGRKVSQSSE
jgi:putative transposase